ncbi:hypothetical protein QLX08_007603 [Tetragonisca angustula]|uniref:Uncharacterized protein n=1 Tax=Tetragonisca angustula TaxID=166442 RepID=A0AAW0ZQG6_9HYME
MRASSRAIDLAELVNRIETPAIVAYNYPNVIGSTQRDLDANDGSRICQIEYQVTKTMPGNCFKLSRGVTGCVSGDYTNPFHPDCF